MTSNRTEIKENIIASATGSLTGADLSAFEDLLKNDSALRSELETTERLLAAVKAQTPGAADIDIETFKTQLKFRLINNAPSVVHKPSRRLQPARLTANGLWGFHWRWNWVPYAVSTCAVSLVLLSLSFVYVEIRPGSANKQTARAMEPDDNVWMPVSTFVTEDNTTLEKLHGRTIIVQELTGDAVIVGERFDEKFAYIHVFNRALFDQMVQTRGSDWLKTVEYAEVTIKRNELTIPQTLFEKFIGAEGSISSLRVINNGNPSTDGFIELWNPNTFFQYQKENKAIVICRANLNRTAIRTDI